MPELREFTIWNGKRRIELTTLDLPERVSLLDRRRGSYILSFYFLIGVRVQPL
jgi:hypothetical protein